MPVNIDPAELVHAMGDAVVVAGSDGNIVLWNPAAERMFGYSESEAMGRSLDIIIPERLRHRHWEGYRETMRTGHTRYGSDVLRVPAVHKDGRALSIAFTVALLGPPGQPPHAIAAVLRDETSRWNEERALRKRVTELEQRLKEAGLEG